MPNYRRNFVPGGTYFFTLVTQNRTPLFESELARTILGTAFRECQRDWPFEIHALVLLPDHLHSIWSLPPGDARYPARWSRIKAEFTRNWLVAGGGEQFVSRGKRRERRRGIWQRRYWEHTIETEDEFYIRFDYTHYNPVKHRYVKCPRDWLPSTFHRWVDAAVYQSNWACGHRDFVPDFSSVEENSGEP